MWQRKGVLSTLLLPLSWLTHLFIRLKRLRYRNTSRLTDHYPPVIVVGNLVVGGTGKTPVVIALTQALQDAGLCPGIISRGYGVQITGSPRTGSGSLEPGRFGDEPALIAQTTGAPLAVHPRRLRALEALNHDFPHVNVVVSDDGLQHLALPRRYEIVVQDHRKIGNGRLLPAGPLREPAQKRESVDVLITNLVMGQPFSPDAALNHVDQVAMWLQPRVARQISTGRSIKWADWLTGNVDKPVAAVAAIGQPDRFFDMLRASGIILTSVIRLPDHDSYKMNPFAELAAEIILITAKDAIKCHHFNDARLWAVDVVAEFSDEGRWLRVLADKLILRATESKLTKIKLNNAST